MTTPFDPGPTHPDRPPRPTPMETVMRTTSKLAGDRAGRLAVRCLLLALLGGTAFAEDPRPGSVLIYPVIREGNGFLTIVSVTNTNLTPVTMANLGGTTDVKYEYVNVFPSGNPFEPTGCEIVDRTRTLTPADTLSLVTRCDNLNFPSEGYLVVHAQNPTLFDTAWAHDYLVGSELVISGFGGLYSLTPVSFQSPLQRGSSTDVDQDGQLDFDDVEYTPCADRLLMDSFLAGLGHRLAFVSLTGGPAFQTTVSLSIWNDNEVPFSAQFQFRCWVDAPIEFYSLVFTNDFLANNTPNDPSELDTDCDGDDDFESGWARVQGLVAGSRQQVIADPAILGVVTGGQLGFERGRPLWRDGDRTTGKFLNLGQTDPEF